MEKGTVKEIYISTLFIGMCGIVTRLWADNLSQIPHKYRRFFTSTKHSDWFRGQPQEFFV
jgi:hypothetical protein